MISQSLKELANKVLNCLLSKFNVCEVKRYYIQNYGSKIQIDLWNIMLCSKNVNVKDFLSFPSPTKLQSIGKELSSSLRDELGANIQDPDQAVLNIVRISTVVTEEDKKSQQNVCQCADDILTEVLKSDRENKGSLVANAFLVYLGLIKGEDKKYRPPSDITGPLTVLNHVVKQSYLPKNAKNTILVFIDKPNPLLLKSSDIRNQLLQTLYSL